ncbi:XK-related protein 8-like isoform X2 [Channa argus]|uniref:XK-related protein 8-like isoform X2 n=1 Tax=Channa argus TaxID=215402 RepID=UPI0035201BD8
MGKFNFSPVDFFFTCAGLLCLLADIVLDVYASVSFYKEKAYVSLGLLMLFLVGSSVLTQVYSWLWYSYEDFERNTKVEKYLNPSQLRTLHVFQLGIYIRHASVVETSLLRICKHDNVSGDLAVYLSHDLSMLRLIETFSEGAPQFVLMLTLLLRHGQLDPITGAC